MSKGESDVIRETIWTMDINVERKRRNRERYDYTKIARVSIIKNAKNQ
jgi:hypothetical protein